MSGLEELSAWVFAAALVALVMMRGLRFWTPRRLDIALVLGVLAVGAATVPYWFGVASALLVSLALGTLLVRATELYESVSASYQRPDFLVRMDTARKERDWLGAGVAGVVAGCTCVLAAATRVKSGDLVAVTRAVLILALTACWYLAFLRARAARPREDSSS